MSAQTPEKTVRQVVEEFYQLRAERLKPLGLDDVLSDTSGSYWSPESESAPMVVKRLIEKYLASFETRWSALIEDTNFCLEAIRLRDQVTGPRYVYKEEMANAQNRITLAFINRYCTLDYGIDWSRFRRFNSG